MDLAAAYLSLGLRAHSVPLRSVHEVSQEQIDLRLDVAVERRFARNFA